jgi:hypothetical protein
MPKSKPPIEISLDSLLRDSPRQATSMELPLALSYRLDAVNELLGAFKPSRAEIIGMLIASARLDAKELEEAYIAYRKLRIREVLPLPKPESEPTDHPVTDNDKVIQLHPRTPGRPAAKGQKATNSTA